MINIDRLFKELLTSFLIEVFLNISIHFDLRPVESKFEINFKSRLDFRY